MIDTNIYNLHCFSVLAQQLNYTKASEILNITQPALSKIVRSLERELGYELFYRSTRSVKLTDAGQAFYFKITQCLNGINQAVYDTQELAKGKRGILRIGFSPYGISDILPELIKEFRKQCPNVYMVMIDGEEKEIERLLCTGELDIAFVTDWGTDISNKYVKQKVYADYYCAVVNVDSPLAQQKSITFDMLRNEKILTLNQDQNHYLQHDYGKNRVIELCTQKGFLPNIMNTVQLRTLMGLCVMVGCNDGVAILASHMEKFVEADGFVKFLPIDDLKIRFHAIACYEEDTSNICVYEFMKIVKQWTEKHT